MKNNLKDHKVCNDISAVVAFRSPSRFGTNIAEYDFLEMAYHITDVICSTKGPEAFEDMQVLQSMWAKFNRRIFGMISAPTHSDTSMCGGSWWFTARMTDCWICWLTPVVIKIFSMIWRVMYVYRLLCKASRSSKRGRLDQSAHRHFFCPQRGWPRQHGHPARNSYILSSNRETRRAERFVIQRRRPKKSWRSHIQSFYRSFKW